MPIEDASLLSVISKNPPKVQKGKDFDLNNYINKLLFALEKESAPGIVLEVQRQAPDLKNRLKALVKPMLAAGAAGAASPATSAAGSAAATSSVAAAAGSAAPAAPATAAATTAELLSKYSIKAQPGIRAEVAGVMQVVDKGHAKHGSNFDSPQTLKQIIDNLFANVSSAQSAAVAERLVKRYGYDPR